MKKITAFILLCFIFLNTPSYAVSYIGYKTYLKGLFAQKEGNLNLAKNEYENVISYDDTAISAYRELINVYWNTGNTQKALETAAKMKELDGESVKTNMFLGNFYLNANEMLLAKQAWEKVLELEPENETATIYLAAYYYSDNKLQESVDYWNKFLQQQPESSEGYFQLGLVQEKLGKLDEAVESYKKASELKKDAKEAYIARARIYETKKQYDDAIKEYEEYIKLFPDNLPILLYLSKCYFENQYYSKSEEILMRAKKIAPSNMTIYYLLGIIYEKEKDIQKAIDVFEYIVKKEPSHASFARLGYYYALKRNFKSADKNFEKAIKLEPFNSEYFYFAGLNCIDAKKYEKAKKYLSDAAVFNPDNINIKFYLATVYSECGDFNSAEKLLDEILMAEPDNVKILNYLGYMYVEKNVKLDKAEKLIKKVIELAPDEPAFLDSAAWLYYKLGNFEEAGKYIDKAVNVSQKLYDKIIYEHAGDINIELGDLARAWFCYAISKDLGSAEASKKLTLIEKKYSSKEINKLTAKRALHNFLRISALDGNYKLKLKKDNFKINSVASVLYAKGYGLKLNFVQNFTIPEFSVVFKERQYTVEPEAVANNIGQNILEITDFINFILSDSFADFLSEANIKQKGQKIIVSDDIYSVVIKKKSGKFTEFSKNNVIKIKLNNYKQVNSVFAVPGKIDINLNKYKFTCESNINKMKSVSINEFSDFQKKFNKNENKDTGKN